MTGEIEWGERERERERKNDRNNNNSKWAPNYTKNVLKRKSTAKIVLSIFRCQKRKSKENVEREKRWRQKRWKSINSSHCRLLRRGRLKVEKWQKSRGDWENGHGFASAGAARGARERERELRRGKCWQLLSALCSCPADSSCPSSCLPACCPTRLMTPDAVALPSPPLATSQRNSICNAVLKAVKMLKRFSI